MRRIAIALTTGVLTLMLALPTFGADVKIGVIDFQKVLKESKAGKAAQEEIKRKAEGLEASLKRKGKEIEDLQSQLQRDALVMSSDKREEKAREIRIKINDAKTLQKKYQNDFKAFEARLIKRIQKEFFELVEEIGRRDGYTLILEKVGVLYNRETVDITDQLIRAYDRRR
jgi:outer membrane protein